MRKHRWLTACVGVVLLLTTAASTTYAQSNNQGGDSNPPGHKWLCDLIPWLPGCNTDDNNGGDNGDNGNNGGPSPKATPELDSLVLFGVGLSGVGGYALTRFRARRRA